MPRFTISPVGKPHYSAEVIAPDAGEVLNIVGRLGCREADVTEDDHYSFSVLLDGNGVWSIFKRDGSADTGNMSAFS